MNKETLAAYVAEASASISKSPGACTIHLVRTPGSNTPWATAAVPVGRARYVTVGSYTRDITLGELCEDFEVADRAMRQEVAA